MVWRREEHRSILDAVFSPGASDVSHIDILTPLGTSDYAALSIHWVRGMAVPVGARHSSHVWRIPFEEKRIVITQTHLGCFQENY